MAARREHNPDGRDSIERLVIGLYYLFIWFVRAKTQFLTGINKEIVLALHSLNPIYETDCR
jgi:hypothetical protein